MSAIDTLTLVISRTMPKCTNPSGWAPHLHEAMTRFRVNEDKDVVAVFLAQIAVESQEMNRLDENLNYSAERLNKVWPKRFPTVAAALPYARNPHRLANFVYANRFGNGGEQSGDGYRYRGRGLKQLTFVDNYVACGEALGWDLVNNPDRLMTKEGAAHSAAWFWSSRPQNLSMLADDLPDDDDDQDFLWITRAINGGTNGIDLRRAYWARAKAALGLV